MSYRPKGLDIEGYIEYEVSKRLKKELSEEVEKKLNELFREFNACKKLKLTRYPDNDELYTINICIDNIHIIDGYSRNWYGNYENVSDQQKEKWLVNCLGSILLRKYISHNQ